MLFGLGYLKLQAVFLLQVGWGKACRIAENAPAQGSVWAGLSKIQRDLADSFPILVPVMAAEAGNSELVGMGLC